MTRAGASLFAIRGVIEGFYGNPWSPEQRLEMVDFIAARGMNTFVYGPKDDPLVRRLWREPYAGDGLARLSGLVARCDDRGVDLVYCLSPGISIRYSSADDISVLCAKLDSVAKLGVRAFGLLLDDIPAVLQHAEDQAAFADLADAHVDVIGRVLAHLGAAARLLVCPTTYWGYGTEPYLARLGEALDPQIDLLWTGRAICSATLDLPDAQVFEHTARRPPLYWDNYPVNDVAMGFELHVGPYRGRDPRLAEASRGVIANPMELFEASKIAIATIADYLADPEAYEPEGSWRAAITDVAGAPDADAFAVFADNVRSSCLSAEDAPVVSEALASFVFRTDQGDGAAAAADLAGLAERLLAAADHLLRGPVSNPALIAECRPWIAAFETGAQAIAHIARLGAAGRLDSDGPAELRPWLVALRSARVRVFGDALDMTLADLTNTHVRPGELTLAEHPGSPG